MTDAGDALGHEAGAHGGAVADRLGTGDSARIARIARVRRRRRGLATAGAVVVACGAVGGTAWALAPEPPMPALDVDDAVVAADIPPVPPRFDQMWCDGLHPDPYVPWTEPGVAIASASVADLGLEVAATPFTVDAATGETEVVEPGSAILFDDAGGFDQAGDLAGVQFDISWTGEALYQVDATAFLVSGERIMTPLESWEHAFLNDTLTTPGTVTTYDATTNTTRTARTSFAQTGICGYGSEIASRPIPPGPASLHTLVQIKGEDGVPLATWVDANGLDGTTVDFENDPDAAPVRTAAPVSDEEREAVRETRAAYTAVPSGEAVLRDRIEAEGVALGDVGRGLLREHVCPAAGSAPLTENVLPVSDFALADASRLFPPLPAEIPVSAVTGGGSVSIEDGAPSSGMGVDARLIFVDADGGVAGVAGAFFSGIGFGGTWEFFEEFDCHDTSGLVEGESYTVVAQSRVWDDRWVPSSLPQPAVWDVAAREVVGTVALEEGGSADE